VVLAAGKATAERSLKAAEGKLERRSKANDKQRARHAKPLQAAKHERRRHVRHPTGGRQTVSAVQDEHDELHATIKKDTEAGSRRHRRLGRSLRRIPPVAFTADFLISLWFFGGVTDVDFSDPLSTSANLAFALVVAGTVTVIAFAYLKFVGSQLRVHKNDAGTIAPASLDPLTRGLVGLAGLGMAVVALFTYTRLHAEVTEALGAHSGGTAAAVGLTVAVVSILASVLVVGVHCLDGSDDTEHLKGLGRALRRPLSRCHKLEAQAVKIEPAVDQARRRTERAITQTVTEASRRRAVADQVVDAGRAGTQSLGPHSEASSDPNDSHDAVGYRHPGGPSVDMRHIRQIEDHLEAPIPRLSDTDPADGDVQ